MPWFILEAIPGLATTEPTWRRMTGDRFAAFSALCLERGNWQVLAVPCPRGCGCNHAVVPRHDGSSAVGICRCQPPGCPDIALTQRDITPLQVSRSRLAQALCQAFGMAGRLADLPAPNTFQFGTWSAAAVPAILTLQVQRTVFRRAVAELAAGLRQPFILFAPTSDFLDAPSQTILENHGAAFFDLQSHVILTDRGTLTPTRPPGELFARFTPQPKEVDLEVARRAFALVRNLDTEKPMAPPTLLSVFRHYCLEELSAGQIARKYECSKPTVLRRLALIRARTGLDPRQLRRLSPHIAKLEADLTDPRARHIHRHDQARNDEEE